MRWRFGSVVAYLCSSIQRVVSAVWARDFRIVQGFDAAEAEVLKRTDGLDELSTGDANDDGTGMTVQDLELDDGGGDLQALESA